MAAGTEPKCDLCNKHGLLLMPVRYAIAPANIGLPAVSEPLKVEDAAHSVGRGTKQNLTMEGGSAQYTARLLRSGYLYVYDEKRDRMDAYWITEDGYYMRFVLEAAVPAEAKSAKPCNYTGHQELAGCISIADARNAGIVWLGYSDVQWTSAVIDTHRGPRGKRLRELHMRAFDAGAWAKSHQDSAKAATAHGRGSVAHAVPMSELAKTVAEYAPAKPAPNGFAPSSAPRFHSHAGKADGVQAACRRRSPELAGAIVALDDPAGVTQDLAALINWHSERLLDTRVEKEKYGAGYGPYPTTYRNLVALDGAIKTLRATNDEKVKLEVFRKANDLADYLKLSYEVAREHSEAMATTPSMANRPVSGRSAAATAEGLARQKELDALIRNPSPKKWEEAQEKSWQAYRAKLNVTAYDGWVEEFKKASDALQKQYIESLAKAHAAWMQSNLLASKLDCTHDGSDPLSGDVYAETLQRCMAATQQIGGCGEIYLRWLKGDITEKTNLLLRALVLRQDNLIKAMAAAPLEPDAVPWKALMEQYTRHVQVLLKVDPAIQAKARQAQAAADRAKAKAEAASREFALGAAMSAGVALFDNPLKRAAEQAEAAAKASQAEAAQAKQDAGPKLVPDSVANVLTQISAQVSTALREYNGNAMERTLARWMAVVGVALKMPAGTVEITGSARETIKALSQMFVDNIADAGKAEGKPLSAQQVRQLTTYAERQVVGSFASGNLASFEEKAGRQAKSRMVVFITEGMENELKSISDPTKKVKVLAEKVTSPGSVREYRLLRAKLSAPMVGTVSAGALAMIDGMCKFAGWKALLESEKKALSFQKTGQQDLRETLGGAMFVGSIAVGVGTVVKAYGTWRNLYATGMTERRAGERLAARADIALRVVGVVNAVVWGVSAAMDFVDAHESGQQGKYQLQWLQRVSGALGLIGAGLGIWAAIYGSTTIFVGLSLTGWGLIIAAMLMALNMLVEKIKGDQISGWLERTYWGRLPVASRYTESKAEQADFEVIMADS